MSRVADRDANLGFVASVRTAEGADYIAVRLVSGPGGTYVVTEFPDGLSCGNWPHPGDKSYVAVAARCGFATDQLLQYCFCHELAHQLVPWRLFGERGYVSRMAAERRKMSVAAAKAEEQLIYYVQVLARDLDDWLPEEAYAGSFTPTMAHRTWQNGYVVCHDEQWLRPAAELLMALRAWRRGDTDFTLE